MDCSGQQNEETSRSPVKESDYEQEDSDREHLVDETKQQGMSVDAGRWPILQLPEADTGGSTIMEPRTCAGGWPLDPPAAEPADELDVDVEMEGLDLSPGSPAPPDSEVPGATGKTGVANDQVRPERNFTGICKCDQQEPASVSKTSPETKKRKKRPGQGTKTTK